MYVISVFCQFCYHKSFFISFQFPLTFQTNKDLIEKFLSQRKEEPEPEKNVVDTTQDSKDEPLFPPQTMNWQLLHQRLVFERDAFLHPSSIPEGSIDALLDPNFLQDQDPNVEQVSSLLALASEKVTQGYKLLYEAESFWAEVYSLVPKLSDTSAKTLLCADAPVVLPLTSSSSVVPTVVSLSSSFKHSKSVDDVMLVPSSKIHHKSSEGLCIPEDFSDVWPLNLDPSYMELEDKRYYECQAKGCSYTSLGKATLWSHVAQFHMCWKASCPSCSLSSFNPESLRKHICKAHPSLKLFVKLRGQTK